MNFDLHLVVGVELELPGRLGGSNSLEHFGTLFGSDALLAHSLVHFFGVLFIVDVFPFAYLYYSAEYQFVIISF